jgi:hypothetical protein
MQYRALTAFFEQLNWRMKWVLCFFESFDEWAKPKVENGYHRFF